MRPCNGAEIEKRAGGPLPDAEESSGLYAGAGVRPLLPGRADHAGQVQRQHHHLRRLRLVSEKMWWWTQAAMRSGTVGEDMELVVKTACILPGKRTSLPHPLCNRRYLLDSGAGAAAGSAGPAAALAYRPVPEHVRHRRILANPKYGMVSFVSYLYFLIYELLSPYIEVFGVLTMAVAAASGDSSIYRSCFYIWAFISFIHLFCR